MISPRNHAVYKKEIKLLHGHSSRQHMTGIRIVFFFELDPSSKMRNHLAENVLDSKMLFLMQVNEK